MLKLILLDHHEGLPTPTYAHENDAGFDLSAAVEAPVTIGAGEWKLIPTGLQFDLRGGFEVQIRPRSGLALNEGLTVLNAPGTIDSGYEGEVGVILHNVSTEAKVINRGDRIAQAVVSRVEQAPLNVVPQHISDRMRGRTRRGSGGFGSTGRN